MAAGIDHPLSMMQRGVNCHGGRGNGAEMRGGRSGWIIGLLMMAGMLGSGGAMAQGRDVPGRFDYYLFTLSWSPQYCAKTKNAERDKVQCGQRNYGFVAHGLWPQYNRGYPRECPSTEKFNLTKADFERLLPIMPNENLIRHEWRAHGTCTGLPAKDYFQATETVYRSILVPSEFVNPGADITSTAAIIRQRFAANNPGLPMAAIVPMCDGQYLEEVRICMTRDLKPRACSVEIRSNCRQEKLVLRPVR